MRLSKFVALACLVGTVALLAIAYAGPVPDPLLAAGVIAAPIGAIAAALWREREETLGVTLLAYTLAIAAAVGLGADFRTMLLIAVLVGPSLALARAIVAAADHLSRPRAPSAT